MVYEAQAQVAVASEVAALASVGSEVAALEVVSALHLIWVVHQHREVIRLPVPPDNLAALAWVDRASEAHVHPLQVRGWVSQVVSPTEWVLVRKAYQVVTLLPELLASSVLAGSGMSQVRQMCLVQSANRDAVVVVLAPLVDKAQSASLGVAPVLRDRFPAAQLDAAVVVLAPRVSRALSASLDVVQALRDRFLVAQLDAVVVALPAPRVNRAQSEDLDEVKDKFQALEVVAVVPVPDPMELGDLDAADKAVEDRATIAPDKLANSGTRTGINIAAIGTAAATGITITIGVGTTPASGLGSSSIPLLQDYSTMVTGALIAAEPIAATRHSITMVCRMSMRQE